MQLCLGWAEAGGQEIDCLASNTTDGQCCRDAASARQQKTTRAGKLGSKDDKQKAVCNISSNIYILNL